MDNVDPTENTSPSPRRSRKSTRKKLSKLKEWILVGVAFLTFGTVIDNNFQIRETKQNVTQSEQLKASRTPSVIDAELKSIRYAYESGGLKDEALIGWLSAINSDQNKIVAISCSPEQKRQLEALDTDMKAAEAYNRWRREFRTATDSRKRDLLDILLIAMEQRNGVIQKSCMSARLRYKINKSLKETAAA